jgi:hypothetical protein
MSDETGDSLNRKVEAALRLAAAEVIERACQTGTPVILWENGKVVERTAEDLANQALGGLFGQAAPNTTGEPE